MAVFGLTSTGYKIKRTPDFQTSLEADFLAAFPGANLSAQGVFGQIIGILAAAAAERDEQNLAVYSSFNLLSAEGLSLDNLGLLMGQARNVGEDDAAYRARLLTRSLVAATPENATSRLCFALQAITGVRYVNVVVQTGLGGYEVIILGGDDTAIAETIFAYHPTGTNILGAEVFNVESGCGFCQEVRFTRPTPIDVCVRLYVAQAPGGCGCDVEDARALEDAVFNSLTANGSQCESPLAVSHYASQFYQPMLSVGAVIILSAEFSRDGGTTYQGEALTLAASEYAVYDRACVEVLFANLPVSPNYGASPATLPGQVGVAFIYDVEAANTGGAATAWFVSRAVLPTGLTLDASGRIVGTPTVPGSYVGIVVRGSNASGYGEFGTFEIVIAP